MFTPAIDPSGSGTSLEVRLCCEKWRSVRRSWVDHPARGLYISERERVFVDQAGRLYKRRESRPSIVDAWPVVKGLEGVSKCLTSVGCENWL